MGEWYSLYSCIYGSISIEAYSRLKDGVENFVVWYVVIDDECEDKIMEVRRFLYNKQDRDNLL